MPITLEQARALDALERQGTFAAAAAALGKGHTAVLYALGGLEDATGLALLDRRAYRTRLTPAGRRVLVECRALLAGERALEAVCAELRTGWEARLGVVFDGVVPAGPLLAAVGRVVAAGAPTRFDVRAEFLAGVEDAFAREDADVMISVLPPRAHELVAVALPPVPMSLVAHAGHALGRGRHGRAALAAHVLLTVRGSDPRLGLPTAGLEARSTVHLNDFASKRAGIAAGLGYGWLPDELVGTGLRLVAWAGPNRHVLTPHLYHRAGAPLGRAAQQLVLSLTGRGGQGGAARRGAGGAVAQKHQKKSSR